MRRYETIAIVDPDISEDQQSNLFDKIRDSIAQQKGSIIKFDKWGIQKLAYEIKKKSKGFYLYIDYCGMGNTVAEIERLFRIDDRVLKYITVLIKKDVDVDKIREELENKENKDKVIIDSQISNESNDNQDSNQENLNNQDNQDVNNEDN